MKKNGYAFFVKRPRILEDLLKPHLLEQEREYEIVSVVCLPAIDYENFITDMLADRQFIEDNGGACAAGETMKCILVRRRGSDEGILVIPWRKCFVDYAAYVRGFE